MMKLEYLAGETRGDAFPTALGWMGAAAGSAGLLSVTLPLATEEAVWAAMSRELGFLPLRDRDRVAQARSELTAYASGQQVVFGSPIDQRGYTDFQWRVLQTLRDIPHGCTSSYAEVAGRAGSPRACRAVGQAVHINRTPVIVPCHRVVGADRSLGGFGGGRTQKIRLLVHEGVMTPGALNPGEVEVLPAVERVRKYLAGYKKPLTIIETDDSTKTAPEAARALGVEVGQIAKSLLFVADGRPTLVVTSGDRRVDNERLKNTVGARRLSLADPKTVESVTGFPVGGVSPVGHLHPAQVLLDVSMRRFPLVFAAAGSPRSALPISFDDLVAITGGEAADVCGESA